MLQVSQECPFLIAPSVLSNVYCNISIGICLISVTQFSVFQVIHIPEPYLYVFLHTFVNIYHFDSLNKDFMTVYINMIGNDNPPGAYRLVLVL